MTRTCPPRNGRVEYHDGGSVHRQSTEGARAHVLAADAERRAAEDLRRPQCVIVCRCVRLDASDQDTHTHGPPYTVSGLSPTLRGELWLMYIRKSGAGFSSIYYFAGASKQFLIDLAEVSETVSFRDQREGVFSS